MRPAWSRSYRERARRRKGRRAMRYIALAMVRDHLDDLPAYSCPPGFGIRTFVPGDARTWARIETLAGEFPDEDRALARFQEDYGAALPDLEDRCFFLVDPAGAAIGTATAWRGQFAQYKLGGGEAVTFVWKGTTEK